MEQTNNSWLLIAGARDPALEELVANRSAERRLQGEYSRDNEYYIRDISLALTRGDFRLSGKKQELLRRLCQIYHVELIPQAISSHRKVIGPVIVAFKKIVFSLLKPLLGRSMAQQREFNATVIAFLAEEANEARGEGH